MKITFFSFPFLPFSFYFSHFLPFSSLSFPPFLFLLTPPFLFYCLGVGLILSGRRSEKLAVENYLSTPVQKALRKI